MTQFWCFLSPHFDDTHFGCGGLLAALRENREIEPYELIVCASEYTKRDGTLVTVEDRMDPQSEAAAILDHGHKFLEVDAENRLDLFDKSELLDLIQGSLVKGTTHIFVPLPSYNQDHRALYDVAMALTRPNGPCAHMTVFAYEVPGQETPGGGAVYKQLAQRHMIRKKAALDCHARQTGAYPQTPEGAEALALGRGTECGVKYAEKFWTVRGWL